MAARSIRTETKRLQKIISANLSYLFENQDEDKNISQRDIAIAAEVSTSTVSTWKTGKALPSVPQLSVIAGLFEVELSWLLTDHPAESPQGISLEVSQASEDYSLPNQLTFSFLSEED